MSLGHIDTAAIKLQTDLLAVAQHAGLELRQCGPDDWLGVCPFHQERTPSFHIHPKQRYFKCFGCGKGGDVIAFVMQIENLPFREACDLLLYRMDSWTATPTKATVVPSTPSTRNSHQEKTKQHRFFCNLIAGLQPFPGSPAETYLLGRGLTFIAATCGVQYHPNWYGHPAVIFPLNDQSGQCVALDGRFLRQPYPCMER